MSKKTNREILDTPLYGKDAKDLYEVTASGDKNLVTVGGMLKTILFQYDVQPRDNSESGLEERTQKLGYASELLLKFSNEEVTLTESDVNLLKALCMGMQFQAGSVRYQLLQHVDSLIVEKAKKDIPSKK